MGRGIFKGLLNGLEAAAEQAVDMRKPSNASWYSIRGGILSAFAVFYFLHPSLLNFQQEMKRKRKRSNRGIYAESGYLG